MKRGSAEDLERQRRAPRHPDRASGRPSHAAPPDHYCVLAPLCRARDWARRYLAFRNHPFGCSWVRMRRSRVIFRQLRIADRLVHEFEQRLRKASILASKGHREPPSQTDLEEAIRLRVSADELFALCRLEVTHAVESHRRDTTASPGENTSTQCLGTQELSDVEIPRIQAAPVTHNLRLTAPQTLRPKSRSRPVES